MKKYLNSYIQLKSMELKGKGHRLDKKFYEILEEAVGNIFKVINIEIIDEEY
ncbi:hypothetical protein [Clostridium cavendishii]|uniref:hypothetical protein n=1 Tax=Clostridium cavendishii TaxID=349931 RepID=UPI001FA82076|nr:hypothetical protein [Clostridium cavendishii]